MKKISVLLLSILSILTFTRCDDETATIGGSIVSSNDTITYNVKTLYASSRSILADDSILANTNRVYIGRFTDPETNTVFTSDFLAQFNCVEDYGFPDNGVVGDTAVSIELKLFFNNYFGDSLNTMRCEVYELDRTLEEGKPYYTNIDPIEFVDAGSKPIATKSYCAIDNTVPDTLLLDDNYTRNITIKLPQEIGNRFISKYYEKDAYNNHIGKDYFSNSEDFINNIFKGVYVKTTQGDGTVIYVSMARLNVTFDYYIKGKSGKLDSLVQGISTFSSTREVLQVNKFKNNKLKEFIDNNSDYTYLRTPAGVFTEVELPISDIIESGDTLNSVEITFTRYNESTDKVFDYTPPAKLLMVRKGELHDFFFKNKINDNITSYVATFDTYSNEYKFNNISRLINYCANEREQGTDDPDWNKVILVPVSITTDSNGSTVAISHNLSMTNARLRGGKKTQIPVKIITSKFNNE
ncbi:MAG: DUF4270 domain-containing protein [Bacteroidaceae bacterium]|nr:DUF4270 domain-containing protein [Bacteroidaceae bacterium]